MRNLLMRSLTTKLQLRLVNDLSQKLDRNEYAAIESVEAEGETTLRVVRYNELPSLNDTRPRPNFRNTTEESSGGY